MLRAKYNTISNFALTGLAHQTYWSFPGAYDCHANAQPSRRRYRWWSLRAGYRGRRLRQKAPGYNLWNSRLLKK